MFARDYRATARAALRGNWALTIGVTLVAGLFGGSAGGGSNLMFSSSANAGSRWSQTMGYHYQMPPFLIPFILFWSTIILFYSVVIIIFGGAVTLGLCQYNIDLVGRRQQPQFGTLFSRFSYFGQAFLLQLVSAIFVFLWTLLLIIPGIIASYRYAMAPYLMTQNPTMGVMESIRASKGLMAGHKWRLFCLDLSFLGWIILSAFTLGIGLLWVIPYMNAARASFFLNLTGQQPGYQPEYQPGYQPNTPPPAGM